MRRLVRLGDASAFTLRIYSKSGSGIGTLRDLIPRRRLDGMKPQCPIMAKFVKMSSSGGEQQALR
jgi:hypothetical protein